MMRSEPVHYAEYVYAVVFEPDHEAGGYVVTCPALPGLVTEGDTLEEARAMAGDAIRCYLESSQKDGLPPPPGEVGPVREKVAVKLQAA